MDQLVADSPCYRVDLLDGLDDQSTTELHDLFDCIDQQGQLAPLRPVDESFDVETRTGTAVGIEVARVGWHMTEVDVDPFALGDLLLSALSAEDRQIDPWLDVSLELTYGVPAADVRSGLVPLDALDRSVLAPLRTVVPVAAASLLDDDLEAAGFLGAVVQDPETARWIRSVGAVVGSPDPAIRGPLSRVVPDLGLAIAETRSPSNDRWSGASGDSLRDVTEFFVVRDNPVVDQISPAIHEMLGDVRVRDQLVPTIDALEADGHLAKVPDQLAWMASVDVDGSPLGPGEVSALYRFVRLLSDANHPVDCEIDLIVTSIDWQLDNLSLATLRLIAGLEPGRVQDLASIVTSLVGNPLSEAVIDLFIDTGICPSFDAQNVDDLRTLEVLQQPEAYDLMAAFIAVLAVLERGETDHLPAFADLAEALFGAGGLEPAEELIRDIGDSAVADDVVALVPVLVHPVEHGIVAGDQPATDLSDTLWLVDWLVAVDPDTALTGFQRLRPWMRPVLAPDDGWVALGRLAALMADERSQTHDVLALVPSLVALDPELTTLDELGPLLGDEELAGALLRIVERREVADALLAGEGPERVALAWWGQLVVNGALEDLLRFVDTVLASVGD